MSELYRVITTPTAFAGLEAYVSYIRQHSPQNALRQARKVIKAILSLERMPRRCKVVAPATDALPAVRAMVVRPLIVYYRIDELAKVVRVLHVVHGAQEQPTRF